MLPQSIEADRFRLRPFRLEDSEAVYEYAKDEQWLRYLPIPLPYTRSDADRFLAYQVLLDWRINPSWAIEVEGRAAGGLNIRFFSDHRVAEIGYAIARRLWGRGYTTEAARIVIGSAFDTYRELGRVRARADARNLGSMRVMEKLGMKREGVLRRDRFVRGQLIDEVIFGVLRSEWR